VTNEDKIKTTIQCSDCGTIIDCKDIKKAILQRFEEKLEEI